MATSADRDDHDEDEKDETAEESAKEKAGGEKLAGKVTAAAADTSKHDDDDDEEEEDEEPAPKRVAPRGRGPGAARVAQKAGATRGRGSLGKSMLLFFVIVATLGTGFVYLAREPAPEAAKPKWTTGQTVDVEITLVRTDRQELSCAAAEEIAGRHCAFEGTNKPWSKGDVGDDKRLLKPYTTTDRTQFTAAGLWSEPALAPDKLPNTRFNVKCKYKVEGSLKDVAVRWEQTAQWYANKEWYAGALSDCKIAM